MINKTIFLLSLILLFVSCKKKDNIIKTKAPVQVYNISTKVKEYITLNNINFENYITEIEKTNFKAIRLRLYNDVNTNFNLRNTYLYAMTIENIRFYKYASLNYKKVIINSTNENILKLYSSCNLLLLYVRKLISGNEATITLDINNKDLIKMEINKNIKFIFKNSLLLKSENIFNITLAVYYLYISDFSKAWKYLIKIDKKNIELNTKWVFNYFGYKILQQNLPYEAKNFLEISYQITPNNYFALKNLGVVSMQLGEYKKAITCFKKAIEINNKDSFLLNKYINKITTIENKKNQPRKSNPHNLSLEQQNP